MARLATSRFVLVVDVVENSAGAAFASGNPKAANTAGIPADGPVLGTPGERVTLNPIARRRGPRMRLQVLFDPSMVGPFQSGDGPAPVIWAWLTRRSSRPNL